MNWHIPVVFAVAFGAALGACVPPIPAQREAAFPHAKHLTSTECAQLGKPECFGCPTCHQDVASKARPSRPSPDTCARCHPDGKQFLARVVSDNRDDGPFGRGIRFTHDKHLEQPQIAGRCLYCHSGVIKPGRANFAGMSTCMKCHATDFDAARCSLCHRQELLSEVRPKSFFRHDSNWIRRHPLAANSGSKICNQCHAETFCDDCHDQKQTLRVDIRNPDAVEREFVHRADWISQHRIEAQSQPASCLRCHSTSSCESCHARRGISATAVGSVNPHPRGWVGMDVSSPNFHGRAARRNIMTCAGCHDQGPATNCIRCHRVGGYAGNPHPSGWRSSRGTAAAMCRYCHE
jgi:hypothetical protein